MSLNTPKHSKLINCPVCSTKMNNRRDKLDIFSCSKCDHIYIDYLEDANEYHRSLYRKNAGGHGTRGPGEVDENNKFTQIFHSRREDICKNRCNYIAPLIKDCNNLLDIGAGGGTFLRHVSKKFPNIELEGQEISTLCIKNLKEDGFTIYEGDFNTINFSKSYDLVTCWHVLEHIKDVKLFAQQVSKITNKYLFIEIPGNKGSHWTPWSPITKPPFDGHHHYFSKSSVWLLFRDYFSSIKYVTPIQGKHSLSFYLTK